MLLKLYKGYKIKVACVVVLNTIQIEKNNFTD